MENEWSWNLEVVPKVEKIIGHEKFICLPILHHGRDFGYELHTGTQASLIVAMWKVRKMETYQLVIKMGIAHVSA